MAHIIGVSVSDTTAETRIVTLSVTANSRNSRPTMSPMNSSGISTAISDTLRLTIVNPIWADPFRAASSGSSPASTYRITFSIMTIASSTTNPVLIVRAISVRLFRLYPSRYMTANVPTSDSGTATAGMIVAGTFRRKAKMTSTTSATVRQSSNSTSSTLARIVVVRSVNTSTWTEAGRAADRVGSRSLTRRTTSIVFAPGCRWTLTTTAGVWSFQAARFAFSVPSITSATSDRITGALFR